MGKKLEWLEFGRGIAALAVVLCHVHWYLVPIPNPVKGLVDPWGWWAVSFFFVLSGFIIFYVHGNDIGCKDRAGRFAWRRFARIFPTYWLVLVIALFCRQYLGNAEHVILLTPDFLVTNLFLFPTEELYINAAWSLRNELLFYGVFLLAIFNRGLGIAAALVWLALILLSLAIDWDNQLWKVITTNRNLFFIVGISIAVLVQRGHVRFSIPAPFFSGWLGRISYPLYISHLPMFLVVHGVVKRLHISNWTIVAPIGIAFCVLIAWIISAFFEQPLLRRSRSSGLAVTTSFAFQNIDKMTD